MEHTMRKKMQFFRSLCTALLILLLVSLCGCGIYNKEYLSISDYVSPIQIRSDENKIIVRNINELKLSILSIVDHYNDPDPVRTIVFDSSYDGDPQADISLACKQTITENALCAYCVEDISYEIYKVVAYYEAVISVTFAETSNNEITKLSYSGELKKYLNDALQNHDLQIILFADYSNYTEEDIRMMVSEYYSTHPLCAPKEPNVHINLFSGSGKQKLYEIRIDYGYGEEELASMMDQIDAFLFPDLEESRISEFSSLEKAAYACSYLMKNCELSSSLQDNTAYSALINGKANSQGLSLAMIALSSRLELDCKLVYGQRNWRNHYWNILNVDGEYYHLDVELCITDGIEAGFLLNDEHMWKTYRWDMSGYPQCSNELEIPAGLFDTFLEPVLINEQETESDESSEEPAGEN